MKMHAALNRADGGWLSRKLALGTLSVSLIFIAWLMTARWEALQAQYMTFVGGVTGLYALFVGANVGNKLVVGKNLKTDAAPGGSAAAD